MPAALSVAVPRTTGEVITDAVDALRRSFGVVFALGVPFCAVDLILREFSQSGLARLTAKLGERSGDPSVLLEQLSWLAASVAAGLASFMVQQLLAVGVIAVGELIAAGEQPTVPAALRRIAERGAAVIVTAFSFVLVAGAIPMLLILVPTVVGTVAAVPLEQPILIVLGAGAGFILAMVALVVMTLRWSLYSVVVVTEGRWLLGALRRSSELTAPRGLPFAETPRFRLSVVLLIGVALAGVLQSLFVGPRLAMAFATGWSLDDGALPGLAALPIWFMVPFGLVEVLTNAAVMPFSALLMFFFTLDLRVRYEGAGVVDEPAGAGSR